MPQTIHSKPLDHAFFAEYEAEVAAVRFRLALADILIYTAIGAFFVIASLACVYVMFSFPQTGDL